MNSQTIPGVLPPEELSYEDALAELEQIVAALESDSQTLEISIKLFERGQALAQHCSALLEKAEQKVRQLVGENLLPFAPGDEE